MATIRIFQIGAGLVTGFVAGYFVRAQNKKNRQRSPNRRRPKTPKPMIKQKPKTPSTS